MTSPTPLSEANEKVESTNVPEIPKETRVKKKGFFSKQSNDSGSIDEKHVPLEPLGEPTKKKEIPPASFTSLFRCVAWNTFRVITPSNLTLRRFTTRKELFFNFLGLIAAAGAGAAQVSYS